MALLEVSALLQELISVSLVSDLAPTALFLAERLYAHEPSSETAIYLYAFSLWKNQEAAAALEVLRKPVRQAVHVTRSRHDKPACEVSVRCAWTYAQCCSQLGRPREGETILAKVIKTMGLQDLPVPPIATYPSPVSLQISLAKLAMQAQQPAQAQAYLRAALKECWWCWEAFEGLCNLGAPPDIEASFGPSASYADHRPLRSLANGAGLPRPVEGAAGFFTPIDAGGRPNGPGVPARFLAGDSMSMDDSSLGPMDQSFYALNHRLRPAAVRANPTSNVAAGSVFSATDQFETPSVTIPSKRSRPRSAASMEIVADIAPPSRSLRGAPVPSRKQISPTASLDGSRVRRSTRLSRSGDASSDTPSISPGRTRNRHVSGNLRPTKKSRAASIASRSSSVDAPDAAEEWLRAMFRAFGRAQAALSQYDCSKALEALNQLPSDQRQSWRAWVIQGRAEFENLDYKAAARTMHIARRVGGDHLLRFTEIYSTLLWHLRQPKELSFLAQDLMAAAPSSAQAWIATGNVFSHLEDHANALKCFRRATQADSTLAYGYTLAGHECVALEEWERALRFFREAIGRDNRHYNAWFGIGNVYLKIGKLRLAEYHFRRASEINPSNAMLVCGLGSVLEKQNKNKEALELYEKAVILAPKNPAVRFKRARMLLILRKNDAAMRDLQWLSSSAPNEFNVHFLLAKLYGIRGDKAQMVLHMTSAQELEPRRAHRVREAIEEAAVQGGRKDETGMEE